MGLLAQAVHVVPHLWIPKGARPAPARVPPLSPRHLCTAAASHSPPQGALPKPPSPSVGEGTLSCSTN
uniref:Uncharacterized protein n=1 Tax=Knipowitschia caucasica TaxID=637954 RepID=A0AAV2LHT8_KNICA